MTPGSLSRWHLYFVQLPSSTEVAQWSFPNLPVAAFMIHRTFSLIVDNLTCVRGDREVFSRLSLKAQDGDAILLYGPNGAGKSSLLRMLAGLLPVTAGSIRWQDPAIALSPPPAYCGHRDPIKAWLTVGEHLDFWCALHRGGRIDGAAEGFGLNRFLSVPCGLLSAGQKRRLSLARLMLTSASVWLLDEPTASLDSEGIAQLETLIADHRAAGGLVIAATHAEMAIPKAVKVKLRPPVLHTGTVE